MSPCKKNRALESQSEQVLIQERHRRFSKLARLPIYIILIGSLFLPDQFMLNHFLSELVLLSI